MTESQGPFWLVGSPSTVLNCQSQSSIVDREVMDDCGKIDFWGRVFVKVAHTYSILYSGWLACSKGRHGEDRWIGHDGDAVSWLCASDAVTSGRLADANGASMGICGHRWAPMGHLSGITKDKTCEWVRMGQAYRPGTSHSWR